MATRVLTQGDMSKDKRHTTRQSSLKLGKNFYSTCVDVIVCNADENAMINGDDTIRRLKLLSKAQTALLKVTNFVFRCNI